MSRSIAIESMPPTVTGKAGKDTLAPVAADDDMAFHALLYPNRSLTWSGFRQVMGLVIAVNIINAVVYLTMGAWPVAFFCGVDILIVWLAFQLSYAQGKRHERIMLTGDALWVSRVLPSGHETRWKLSPVWVKVLIDRPAKHESQLRLVQNGRTLIVGSFLSPKERGELGDALHKALRDYRAPVFS
ncbi:DUF2244 domain-containing protein [Parvularcula sp. LCG005]|uniref:DUF2244 domain-containing protein n=1 Tax=Parvularcula sp. LCG005 TaxID=3078805 RepID=UPI0029424994|nr:DUF2244 domain-containing protein [Parvularcula sp. LCG005]WOI53240.1 DUF2244 domain-containing protein [Parvularcula sp. LCG005]